MVADLAGAGQEDKFFDIKNGNQVAPAMGFLIPFLVELDDPSWRAGGNIAAVSRIVFLFFLLDLEFLAICTKNRYFYARLICIYKKLPARPVLGSFDCFKIETGII